MKEKRYIHKNFHGALSVCLEFLDKNFGKKEVEEYLKQVAKSIYGWLIKKIKKGGLFEVEKYWNEIFKEEEGEFKIERKGNKEIILKIERCPAISFMKEKNYPIYYNFCIQCKIINEFIGEKTGFNFDIKYDIDGKCEQKFIKK